MHEMKKVYEGGRKKETMLLVVKLEGRRRRRVEGLANCCNFKILARLGGSNSYTITEISRYALTNQRSYNPPSPRISAQFEVIGTLVALHKRKTQVELSKGQHVLRRYHWSTQNGN